MKTLLVATLLCAAAVNTGCGAIDAAFDCHAICARYSECWDSKYDVAACESRCRGHSSTDTEYRRNADTCNACITSLACVNATFSCGAQCSNVIP